MKTREKKQKTARLFKPDPIADSIGRALFRDFGVDASTLLYANLDDPKSTFLFNQVLNFQKKYERTNLDEKALRNAAYDKFYFVNEHLRNFSWDRLRSVDKHARITRSLPVFDRIMIRAQAFCQSILGDLDEEAWFSGCCHGSGSTIGVNYAVSANIEAKWKFPLSGTRAACLLFDRYLNWNSKFHLALLEHNDCNYSRVEYTVVRGSRTTTVPKDSKTKRLIAVEPTVNMFFQKGLEALMVNRLKSFGLDLSLLQEVHKETAYIASITRKFATVDFSSASDCVSLELCKFMLSPDWFYALGLVRCETTEILGKELVLPMISTMGNATTFPLETLFFYSIAMACHLETKDSNTLYPEWADLKVCSTFGDDNIVPAHLAELFMAVCESVGFIVNKEKSFFGEEYFRESCGGDYCHGRDVRPYYISAPQSTNLSSLEPWLYIITNRILKKYIQYFGSLTYVYHTEVLTVLAQYFQKYGITIKCVPSDFPDDAGLKILNDFERIRPIFRWCRFSPVVCQVDNGLLYGSYLRFVYFQPKGMLRSDGLQLEETLRIAPPNYDPLKLPEPTEGKYTLRRRGKYVVCKGSFYFTDPLKVRNSLLKFKK